MQAREKKWKLRISENTWHVALSTLLYNKLIYQTCFYMFGLSSHGFWTNWSTHTSGIIVKSDFFLCDISQSVKWQIFYDAIPAGIYLLKVNNRNNRSRCEISSKLTIKTPERRHWTYFIPCSSVSYVTFEHVIAGWDILQSWTIVAKSFMLYVARFLDPPLIKDSGLSQTPDALLKNEQLH